MGVTERFRQANGDAQKRVRSSGYPWSRSGIRSRESAVVRLVQHQPATFRTGIFPGCLNTSQLKGLWNCVRAQRQSIFRLESEIRHVTNTGEISRCATLLNSGDVATLLSGPRLAPVESADILSCGLALKSVRASNSAMQLT